MKTNILLFIIFSAVVGGCYTVYNHPNVVHKDNNNMVEIVEVTYKNDCQSCHTTDELENYNYYVKKDVFVESDSTDQSAELKYNDIAYFYNMPWWFEVELSNQYNEVKYDTEYSTTTTIVDEPRNPGPHPHPPGPGPLPRPGPNPGPTPNPPTTNVENTNNNTNTNSSSGTSNTRGNDGSRNNSSGRR